MKQKGFTIIELMIVVAIVGILAAVAVPAWKGQYPNSRAEVIGQLPTRVIGKVGECTVSLIERTNLHAVDCPGKDRQIVGSK